MFFLGWVISLIVVLFIEIRNDVGEYGVVGDRGRL